MKESQTGEIKETCDCERCTLVCPQCGHKQFAHGKEGCLYVIHGEGMECKCKVVYNKNNEDIP